MGKKAALVLVIVALLLVAAGLLYWKAGHPGPRIAARPAHPVAPAATGPERGAGNAESGRPGAGPTAETKEKKGSAPGEPGFTLRVGEALEFAANVTQLNSTIANLKIVTAERRNFHGKNSWHLQAFAHTENPYRMVFELDDQFDSYSAAGDFASQQYELHLSERGQKVDSVQRLLSSPQDAAPAEATAARVPAGTRDPLGLLQYLRGIDWGKTPEIQSPVYDGRKFYEVRAVLLGKAAAVQVPAGNYIATKIAIHVYEGGVEMKDAHFLLYLSNDAARLPVLLEAVLPVVTARVELTKAS
ncbi:MAG TPA: DUF3108 domain-containing protein [Candidatus Acidoferrum sp.]|nr:DUF3108 domain-containing protein [Candidatus Acidoferrum sp.]